MSNLIITADYKEGSSIEQVAADVHDLCAQVCCNVRFTFQGVEMVVNEYQFPGEVIAEWRRRKEHENIVQTGGLKVATKY